MSEVEIKNNNILTIPLIFGSISICTGKKGETYFYKWIIFLKSAEGINLDHIIENVKFVLHVSFENSLRTSTKCPYYIEEEGWGEFDVILRLTLRPPFNNSHIELSHGLKVK